MTHDRGCLSLLPDFDDRDCDCNAPLRIIDPDTGLPMTDARAWKIAAAVFDAKGSMLYTKTLRGVR